MESESLDHVDESDIVLEALPREEIYGRKLRHRIVHILIFNEKGEMALQLRSRQKSFCPLHWSTAVGGHVQAGESYEQAALREFQEELGTTASLTEAWRDDYYSEGQGIPKKLVTYTTVFEGPFTVAQDEVERVEFFSLDRVREMLEANEKLHPELLFILEKHYKPQDER